MRATQQSEMFVQLSVCFTLLLFDLKYYCNVAKENYYNTSLLKCTATRLRILCLNAPYFTIIGKLNTILIIQHESCADFIIFIWGMNMPRLYTVNGELDYKHRKRF